MPTTCCAMPEEPSGKDGDIHAGMGAVAGGHKWSELPPNLPVMAGSSRPILLKKSAMVSTTEKYALEIEIFTLSRGFRVQISRSGAQKRHFQRSVCGQSGRTDFFNRIDPKLPKSAGGNAQRRPDYECNRTDDRVSHHLRGKSMYKVRHLIRGGQSF